MTPQKNQIFYHYKYFLNSDSAYKYKIIGLAGNANNDKYHEKWVVYEPLDKSLHLEKFGIDSYIRPLEEFLETVEVDGHKLPRFTLASHKANF
jgi:hypothetical protein